MKLLKSANFWTIVGLVVSILLFSITLHDTKVNDEKEKAEKSTIALCNLREVIYRQTGNEASDALREGLDNSIADLQKIDLVKIDENVQEFILKARMFYSNIKYLLEIKAASPVEQKLRLQKEIENFYKLTSDFELLKKEISNKYQVKIIC